MSGFASRHPVLVWSALAIALAVPIAVAATSPLLQWRDATYIIAGLAGVVAMALLLLQPLLIGGLLPRLPPRRERMWHRWLGALLLALVLLHVGGLWLTSPPDVLDALLFASPTPFSIWGVIAMWAVLATGLLAGLRKRLRRRHWLLAHRVLAAIIVAGTVLHALLIEGTMGTVSKIALAGFIVAASALTLVGRGSSVASRR